VLDVGNRTLSVTFTPTDTTTYSTVMASVTITVNQAQLTITASSPNMIYGGAVPAITPGYAGFLGTDSAANLSVQPTCVTTATSTSNVGTYPSSCSGAVATNYTITYVPGVVTVAAANTTTSIVSHTPNPSIPGQSITVAFSVTPQAAGVFPGGNVTVTANTGETCTGALNGGGAGSCSMILIAGGTKTLTAVYSGNPNFLGSTSVSVNHVVTSVNLSTTSLLFGNQLLNTYSSYQAVTLTNVGTTRLTITGFTYAGDFSDSTNCGASLNPGSSCRFNVRFRPTALGIRTGTLQINTSDPAMPIATVALTGTGVAGAASVTPSSLAFSSALNVTSAPQTVTVANAGTAQLVITSIGDTGTNANQFTPTNVNCPIRGAGLAPGSNCIITVTFRPTSATPATKNATLNVAFATIPTQSVTLTGNIIVPTYTFSETAYDFGTWPVSNAVNGGWSSVHTFTLTNTSQAPVTGLNYTFTGSNRNQFRRAPAPNAGTCGAQLAVGVSCTINVQFNPSSVGLKTATLNTNPATPATNVTVALSGTGQ
jgi:hypothetical protein